MAEPSMTATEILRWNDTSFQQWLAHMKAAPGLLDAPCDIMGVTDLRGLMRHIVFVERRLSFRLQGLPDIGIDEIPAGLDGLADIHRQVIENLTTLAHDDAFDWELVLPVQTRNMGVIQVDRRTLLIHLLMHSIRHYAQMATIARHAGHPANWRLDYLMTGVATPKA